MVAENDFLHMVIRRTRKFRSWKKTGEKKSKHWRDERLKKKGWPFV